MITMTRLTAWMLGLQATWKDDLTECLTPRRRGERGLSQSTETALLVAAAVVVATIIIGAVTYVVNKKTGEALNGVNNP